MLGDLNSHNTIWWECQKTNKKDYYLKKVININNFWIQNNTSNTYLNPFTRSYSATELSLCDSISYRDYGWKVHNNIGSSDHSPIIPESSQPLHEDRLPHWKINKANWQDFETICKQKLLKDSNIIDKTKHFAENLISIANVVETSA